ncbi:hypothetical protein K438DRAFT_1966087 [Mycena galopus ATCC 62051]|nr:hypothetical protein K438DRAFT_1966087 [Mycena galopus ATCC 62051]
MDEILFRLQCFPNTQNHAEPEGYLFVCPAEDFQTGPASLRWPDCPAYWSLEPSGAARLSTEDAKLRGFPVIHMETIIWGHSWDKGVYDGLRRFHQGKEFDPDSRDVAKHLGYPSYMLSSEVDAPLLYVENLYLLLPPSTSPDALFVSSEDGAVDPLVPRQNTGLILATPLSAFISFLLKTVLALSLLPTIKSNSVIDSDTRNGDPESYPRETNDKRSSLPTGQQQLLECPIGPAALTSGSPD